MKTVVLDPFKADSKEIRVSDGECIKIEIAGRKYRAKIEGRTLFIGRYGRKYETRPLIIDGLIEDDLDFYMYSITEDLDLERKGVETGHIFGTDNGYIHVTSFYPFPTDEF